MAEYIGRRIVPTHGGVWNETKEYEELTIVLDEESGDSYISRIPVPSGTALDDEEYWMLFSIYSEQIQEALDAIEETSEEMVAYVDKTAASLTEYVQETATELTEYVDDTAESLTAKVEAAEDLTESNTDTLNERMDLIETRQDANVTASTDSDADYAAEVVDARVHDDETVYDSLGAHVRALDTGEAVESLDLYKVDGIGLSMKTFYELLQEKSTSSFEYSYVEETDTLTLACVSDYSGDFILYAPMWTPVEFAHMKQIGGKLLIKFQTSDVVNDSGKFNIGLWTGKASGADSQTNAGGLIGSVFTYSFKTGSTEYEKLVSFSGTSYDYDDSLGCYVYNDYPVNLQLLLYANKPSAGDTITVCGNGGLFTGIRSRAKEDAFCRNIMAGEIYSLTDRMDTAESDISEAQDQMEADEEEMDLISQADAHNCRIYDFEPSGIFAPGTSTYEVVTDEYGDESYHIIYGSNNPMYQMDLSDILEDEDREVIIEYTARLLSDSGGSLRVHLYNQNNGATLNDGAIYYTVTESYRKYQIRMTRRNIGPIWLGIGPDTVQGDTEVQFKDVRILIPNEDTKQVQASLKHFYGCPGSMDFSEQTAVLIDEPLIFGTDDYADEDDLYLDTVEVYSTVKASLTFYVGCIDQYGLFQQLSSFSGSVRAGTNFLKYDDKKIAVPSGYGVFVGWNESMAVYDGMTAYGYNSLISTSDNYYEDDAGYSGYPLTTTSYMVPLRYTLIEKPLPVLLDEIQESVEDAEETVNGMDERVQALEEEGGTNSGISLIDPNGVRFGLLVGEDGTLNSVRSIPNKAVVYGNSLTLGFGTFGMAASDSSHDWYYYVQQSLLARNEDLEMSRYSASSWEGMTDSDSRKEYIDDLISTTIDGTEDLVIIQLSDNVNTTEKKATFAEDMYTILYQFRTACPNARIVWIAAWYNWSSNYEFIENACTDLGIDLVDIRDLSTDSENQSAVGNVYTKDDGTEVEITSTGVASHPGDTGMELIAERVIEALESYM